MRVDLNAKVRTSDGEDAGTVQSAIVDPRTGEVMDFVINTGGLFGRDLIVTRTELEGAARDGNTLRLTLSKADLERLPTYEPAGYTTPPAGWIPPSSYLYPSEGFLWPVLPQPLPQADEEGPTASAEANRELQAETSSVRINQGAPVFDREGEDIGVVEEVRLDLASGRLMGVVIRYGSTLQTLFGQGHTVEIPGRLIERAEEGAVRLRIAKEDLPKP